VKRLLIVSLLLFCGSNSALAVFETNVENPFSVRNYMTMSRHGGNWLAMRSVFYGYAQGLLTIQSELMSRGMPVLVCLPTQYQVDDETIINLLDDFLKDLVDGEKLDAIPITLVILPSFEKAFPCE